MIELILGGARSGKSRLAEARITDNSPQKVIYIATATAYDDEMRTRIKHHQQRRPDHWQLIEEPIELGKIIQQYNQANTVLLIECLTLWLTNLLCHSDAEQFALQKKHFIEQLQHTQAEIILVSNETGMGVVPMGELSRRFVDEAGFLHQTLAQLSDRVTLVVAGLEHCLKQPKLSNSHSPIAGSSNA
ncbi:bifunctional adenosylcobinamide kinase/adenosylcobinamide-phosphate guanylyltransferase [sulfur-oxidizing endosymbiont of Gigantopelta aegis]|uniref:bifunctional adenosylcobinamide kinase/adenosylcobinamide-phosphate guanylyltransferase n=1 Tax=sulfur-oxidizing endosymbiont of Gigantopelta aegis TaxID=2794934 RepID=UPI0018DD666F|nr:bifunctional adenosylcobinamide kinase/adenosylcobinamide-phosphate guanylyltransferase [sulfur-oxidizing endosymbiont of Gigantopelta aegis]